MVMVLSVNCFVNADKMHGLSKWCVILIWMVSFTVVTGQDCNISNFNNGQISNLNIDIVGMEETYSNEKQIIVPCKHGFTGFFKIKCSGGDWTKVLGDKCIAKSCGHPGESLNADFTLVSGTDFVFPSQVQYKCHEGYIMVSRNPYRRCLDQGWSGNTPTCEAIKCPDITVDENVLVTGNRLQSSYGNVLQFGCRNKLLALYGPLHIRCEGNGQWNEGPPKCDEVKCKVPDIANGRANNTEYAEGQHLTITCNPGYSPSGRRPQCLNIRKRAGWSQTPLCERVTCQLLQERGTTYLDVYKDRFLTGETVSVKCARGHWFSFNDQQTQKTITCTESGEWNTAVPCQEIRCQDPNDPNLKERLQSTRYGGYAYYRCKEGFMPTAYVVVRCTENGWTPNPLCEAPSQCNLPKRVENAVITEKKRVVYSDGDKVTYKCRTNYRMEGERIIKCQRGQWTQGTPTCIRVTCRLLQVRGTTYLDVYKNRFLPGETVSVKCHQGYWFSFNDQQTQKTITCTKSGEWNTAAECHEIRCQDSNYPNLKEQLQSKRIGENALYQCQEGFTPTDARTATCTENGWTPNPLCEEIRCQDSNDPNLKEQLQSKRIGENALYQCQEGFTPTDARTATCTENGWTPNPLCKANGAELEKVEPTVVPGSSATTTAANGAELEKVEPTVVPGSSATTTADSGSEITCGDPPSLPDGEILGYFKAPHKHGVKVRYHCEINFTIEGDVKTCENGQWTGETRCLANGAELEKVEPTVVPGSSATTTA
ncbi:unnamed protein product, partial [Boreogadus saida]